MSTEAPKINNMKKTLCFLISGKAGVGKSYASTILKTYSDFYGIKCLEAHFASEVKHTAYIVGWDGVKDEKGRKLLQDIGKVGRQYNKDTWAKLTFDSVFDKPLFPYDVVVIDDWRFPNESEYIERTEPLYKVVKIHVRSKDREILKGTAMYNDESETSLDGYSFDYTIDNYILDGEHIDEELKVILEKEIRNNTF